MACSLELAAEKPRNESTVLLSANLFSARGKLSIKLLSLSNEGATGTCSVSPPCGSFAYVGRNKVKVPTIIGWADDDRFGLTFEQPLDDERRRTEFRSGRQRKVARAHAQPSVSTPSLVETGVTGRDVAGSRTQDHDRQLPTLSDIGSLVQTPTDGC